LIPSPWRGYTRFKGERNRWRGTARERWLPKSARRKANALGAVLFDGTLAVFAGAVGLGLLHGIEPGHGWPLAASYAIARPNRYVAGFAASAILGTGHLISSIAVVVLFFGLKEWLELAQLDWMNVAAGTVLIALGLWELRGHHGYGHGHQHVHGHDRDHGHAERGAAADKGLWGLAGAAFALGFAHEEEFQIIGLCAGSDFCLELMLAYAFAVVLAMVALTLLLIAGYQRWRHRLEHWAPHLPKVSAGILILMGVGFVAGVL
jgi:ABC-type nickel/cobalt efflux system permease component RcnA